MHGNNNRPTVCSTSSFTEALTGYILTDGNVVLHKQAPKVKVRLGLPIIAGENTGRRLKVCNRVIGEWNTFVVHINLTECETSAQTSAHVLSLVVVFLKSFRLMSYSTW